jgi:hypothetical protein
MARVSCCQRRPSEGLPSHRVLSPLRWRPVCGAMAPAPWGSIGIGLQTTTAINVGARVECPSELNSRSGSSCLDTPEQNSNLLILTMISLRGAQAPAAGAAATPIDQSAHLELRCPRGCDLHLAILDHMTGNGRKA